MRIRSHTGLLAAVRSAAGRAGRRGLVLATVLSGLSTAPAAALVRFDFEQPYYVHQQRQVWDFCLVQPDTVIHLFYHSIHQATPYASRADTIWHATTADLVHWTLADPVLTSGPDAWDAGAIWAPDVVRDEARGLWVMAYTGVDAMMVQRLCLAESPDLTTWTKAATNPVFEPDSTTYYWSPTARWSSYRDPFIYRQDGTWHLLSTAILRLGTYPDYVRQGIVHHLTSDDLLDWTDAGVFFAHDGVKPWHEFESCQYVVRDGRHHLFFTEQDVNIEHHATSHLVADAPGDWTMADSQIVDAGWAPEIHRAGTDAGLHDVPAAGADLFARLAKGQDPLTGEWFVTVRFDSMVFDDGGLTPVIRKPHPLDRDWAERSGDATLGNPVFGDNPVRRGGASSGMVGNGWFGSAESYQGPLSGYGAPGEAVGDSATGVLTSRPFVVTGNRLDLLVGGGYYPASCYVALVDAAADTILFRETGHGAETMTPRTWDLTPHRGKQTVIRIVDQEQGPFGHINVDEIEEIADWTSGVESIPRPGLLDPEPRPNPFNPGTELHFSLAAPGRVGVSIHDVRGRLVWRSPCVCREAGPAVVAWDGRDLAGRDLPAGIYLYRIDLDDRPAGRGKLTLLK